MYKSKVVILGNSTVGKSSILTQFKLNQFNVEIDSTIGCEFFAKSVMIKGDNEQDKEVKLLLWDTAGQEVFRTFTKNFLRGAQVVLIIFDVTNRDSFDDIIHWLDETKMGAPKSKIVIAGNKNDLPAIIDDTDIRKLLSEYQFNYNFDYYGTITATENKSVYNLFHYISQKIINDDLFTLPDLDTINLDKTEETSYCC